MKMYLLHLATIRSIDKLGPLNLHPLTYQMDGYRSPINLNQGQVQRFLLTILVWMFLTSASVAGLAGNQLHMCNLISCKYTLRKQSVYLVSTADTQGVFKGELLHSFINSSSTYGPVCMR